MSEQMPRPAQFKPLKEIRLLDDAIDHPEVIKRFQNALGNNLDAVTYLATIRNLSRENEMFKQADVWEVIRCALDLAELGLRPNTPFGHAWIIPRVKFRNKPEEKVTLDVQIGYQGWQTLAYRSGTLQSLHADVVLEGDEFSYEYGTNAHLRHVPKGAYKDRNPIKAYCHAKLTNGGEGFVVWDYADVLDIRNDSEAYKYALSVRTTQPRTWETCVWRKFPMQQAKKTMVKQLLKELPRSSEDMLRASHIDGLSDSGKLSYAGSPGDLSSRHRELTHETNSMLHDLAFKAPVVSGTAETVSTKSAAPANEQSVTQLHPDRSLKKAAEQQAKHEQQQSDPQADLDDEHIENNAQQQENFAGNVIFLVDADGHEVIAAASILEWTKKFLEHHKEVPDDLVDAYYEMNEVALSNAMGNAQTLEMLVKAGFPKTNQAATGADTEVSEQKFSLKLVLPTGRTNDKDFSDAVSASLALVTEDTIAVWRALNDPILNGLPTKQKITAYQLVAKRSIELGIVQGK